MLFAHCITETELSPWGIFKKIKKIHTTVITNIFVLPQFASCAQNSKLWTIRRTNLVLARAPLLADWYSPS